MAFFIFLLFFSINGFIATTARDTFTPNRRLLDGETLDSVGGTFTLGFFSPSSSSLVRRRYVGIWINDIDHTVVWVANRQNPITDSTGVLSISDNGTLRIAAQNSVSIIWSSSSPSSLQNPVAELLDTGNFVVRRSNSNEIAWQSFDYPTDTLLAGMKLGWDLSSGLNRNLTSWSRNDDPSLGSHTLSVDLHGYPQAFLFNGGTKEWRLGSWNGVHFVGVSLINGTTSPFTFSFVNNIATGDEVYFMYNKGVGGPLARMVLMSDGQLQWLNLNNGKWNLTWSNPKGCQQFPSCGAFGVCDVNNSPVCQCIPGFQPRSPPTNASQDGHRFDGCVRRTMLDCKNGTDGFYVVKHAKIPDMTYATVDLSIGLDYCKARCLANCSCTGYASTHSAELGCTIWSTDLIDVSAYESGGQDLYVRLAAADLEAVSSSGKNNKWRIVAAILSVLGTFVLISVLSLGWRIRRRGKKRVMQEQSLNLNNDILQKLGEYEDGIPESMIFGFSDIAGATDNFSSNNKLGEGGFGPVYKGQLPGAKEVAVKRLSTGSGQGLEEFKNEILLIAKLQHRNLVRLLGCCIEGEEKLLIYEYMPNKSLNFFLFDPCRGSQLDWDMRFRIIEGIAQGLMYLHKHSRLRIIHRDLKASNILLDNDMNPKISDFGLARIFSSEEIQANTHRIVGTYGYMAPEYASLGIFSIKSDVFSYGVLMLEILSGKRNIGFHQHGSSLTLQAYAWELWKEGKSLELMDRSIAENCSTNKYPKCVHIALLCVQESAADRPTMSDVIGMLSSDSVHLVNPKRPAFSIPRPPDGADFISDSPGISSLSGLSVTTLIGR